MPPIIVPSSAPLPSRNVRGGINEIIPGRVYQRGQILTWQREKKYEVLSGLGVGTVVNFWPKQDPDLAESLVLNYLQISTVRSEMMLDNRIETVARAVAELSADSPTLILCEAGRTRSVYFCVLVVAEIQQMSLEDALTYVLARVGGTSLKGFMLDRIRKGK